MQNLLFYISGHGYGHATRSVELINALAANVSDAHFHIKTNAPAWIFELNLQADHTLHRAEIDIGAVQETSFRISKQETLKAWTAFLKQRPSLLQQEMAFCQRSKPRVILGDIPPIAFDVAHEAGLRSIAIANFSWDWIFRHYVDESPEFAPIVDAIAASYSKADCLLRLPFHGDLSAFSRIVDIPLIARRSRRPRRDVLQEIGLVSKDRPIVLVAFRSADLQSVNLERAFSSREFRFVTFGLHRRFSNSVDLAADALPFPELINACDAVVSKPGYGLVSDVIANRTPLLYTSRDDFAEYEVLVRGLQDYTTSEFIPRGDFLEGDWASHLNRLLAKSADWPEINLEGADVAAREIMSVL